MTNSEQAIREFVDKWGFRLDFSTNGELVNFDERDGLLSDLTALISEHYYPKEFVQWITRPEKVAVLWSKAVDRGLDELFNYWKDLVDAK